ncbi:hypothetical protein TSUD_28630 [Trifolium subterraneum]|uniref:Uncharacterized protein n=1 Tax=Trifolium subterraneum TaxID=3900 RepID=A0A2Z6NJ39_TRISU|nr:hypothetical protein TSUD_28630 [Trifolium subterraneum]
MTLLEITSGVGRTPLSIDGETKNRVFRYYDGVLVDLDLPKMIYDVILVER